jgi:hypothetical protein
MSVEPLKNENKYVTLPTKVISKVHRWHRFNRFSLIGKHFIFLKLYKNPY